MIGSLREIKTAKEIEILKQAVAMSAIGQVEVMKAIHPNISERELQGIHEFIFKNMAQSMLATPQLLGQVHMDVYFTTMQTLRIRWVINLC